jgi:hypothetical protein
VCARACVSFLCGLLLWAAPINSIFLFLSTHSCVSRETVPRKFDVMYSRNFSSVPHFTLHCNLN